MSLIRRDNIGSFTRIHKWPVVTTKVRDQRLIEPLNRHTLLSEKGLRKGAPKSHLRQDESIIFLDDCQSFLLMRPAIISSISFIANFLSFKWRYFYDEDLEDKWGSLFMDAQLIFRLRAHKLFVKFAATWNAQYWLSCSHTFRLFYVGLHIK